MRLYLRLYGKYIRLYTLKYIKTYIYMRTYMCVRESVRDRTRVVTLQACTRHPSLRSMYIIALDYIRMRSHIYIYSLKTYTKLHEVYCILQIYYFIQSLAGVSHCGVIWANVESLKVTTPTHWCENVCTALCSSILHKDCLSCIYLMRLFIS